MYLSHLSVTHFRNHRHLELDFSGALTLVQGPNAQGKTNLLEAIYYLATSKPVHAQHEREVVGWQAKDEPIPYCRVAATIREHAPHSQKSQEVEIILTSRGEGEQYQKQVKINGVNRRAMDLIGLLRAVLFLPEDIKLVAGSPSERRRYLDIALCQIDREYCRSLSAYQKILTQRNSLLKALRERRADPTAGATTSQIDFWDAQLVQHGSDVISARHNFLLKLEELADNRLGSLTDERERLQLQYLPSFNLGLIDDGEFQFSKGEHYAVTLPQALQTEVTVDQVAEEYAAKLQHRRGREIAAGLTLYGPHRDDLRFLVNRNDLRMYGSRGQQRTGALALKLAETEVMQILTGRAPLLLLDDVMSELDAQRRQTLLNALDGVEQAIVTTTDWADFSPAFRKQARLLTITGGIVEPVEEEQEG